MNKKEKIKLVTDLINHYSEIEKQLDALLACTGGDYDSPLANSILNMFDAYTDSVSNQIGDTQIKSGGDSWLAWFIFENACGRNGMDCSIKGKKYRIKSVTDLINFMEYCNERGV